MGNFFSIHLRLCNISSLNSREPPRATSAEQEARGPEHRITRAQGTIGRDIYSLSTYHTQFHETHDAEDAIVC